MSGKDELCLSDFDLAELWAFDDDADDVSFVPLHEIPRFANRQIDLGPLFFRCQARLADGSSWAAIAGLYSYEGSLYYLEIFPGDAGIGFHRTLGCDVDVETLESSFGRPVQQILPIVAEHRISALDVTVRGVFS